MPGQVKLVTNTLIVSSLGKDIIFAIIFVMVKSKITGYTEVAVGKSNRSGGSNIRLLIADSLCSNGFGVYI